MRLSTHVEVVNLDKAAVERRAWNLDHNVGTGSAHARHEIQLEVDASRSCLRLLPCQFSKLGEVLVELFCQPLGEPEVRADHSRPGWQPHNHRVARTLF